MIMIMITLRGEAKRWAVFLNPQEQTRFSSPHRRSSQHSAGVAWQSMDIPVISRRLYCVDQKFESVVFLVPNFVSSSHTNLGTQFIYDPTRSYLNNNVVLNNKINV